MGEDPETQKLPEDNREQAEEEIDEKDRSVLQFLDSTDSYLLLMNALHSTLRQGWFELASARHSMGASRVNGSLFDLKNHSAATTLQLSYRDEQPSFTLCKWSSSDSPKSCYEEMKFQEDELSHRKPRSSELECQSASPISENQDRALEGSCSPQPANDLVKKERLKSLAMFGMLVSPKLRDAQLSFERALEIVTEIANSRGSLQCAYDRVMSEMDKNAE